MRARSAVPAIAAVAATLMAGPVPAALADPGVDGGLRFEQWGLDTVGAAKAWEQNEGAGVTIAVLDTGVRPDHPDLADRVTQGDDTTGQDADPGTDGFGESGTRMAGLVAASGHGKELTGGVFGVAPSAQILSVRVAVEEGDAAGGDVPADAQARGVRSAVTGGAQVIALTAGPVPGAGRDELGKAVAFARRNGVVVVRAADSGAVKGALSVRASGRSVPPTGGGLHAPGEQVETTQAGGGYGRTGGDGAAAAFTAGAAALVRAQYPQLQPDQVIDALTTGAKGGVLNAPGALKAAKGTAKEVPAFDPELARPAEDAPLVPVWAYWAGGAVLLVLLIVVGVVLLRRAGRNPYDLPEREDGERKDDGAPTPARGPSRRRQGRGRRRAPSRR